MRQSRHLATILLSITAIAGAAVAIEPLLTSTPSANTSPQLTEDIATALAPVGPAPSTTASTIPVITAPSTTTATPTAYVRVVAIGDLVCTSNQRRTAQQQPQKNTCRDYQVAELTRSLAPDQVWFLGDLQYETGTIEQFDANFIPIWRDFMGRSEAIVGNHDSGDGFKTYFPALTNQGWFSRDLNGWHVAALDTNCRNGSCRRNSTQHRWLRNELQANAHRCTIALGHHPRYSNGQHGDAPYLETLVAELRRAGVVMYLSAHDHNYERLDTQPTQLVVGTGGKNLRSARSDERTVTMLDEYHGVLVLDVFPEVIEAAFVDISGEVRDTFSLPCAKG